MALRIGRYKARALALAGEVIEMIWKRFLSSLGALFVIIVMVCTSIGVVVADPTGLWLVRDGAHVEIAPCGNELCGVLVSASSPIDPATGRPWADKNNIDPNLRNRPLVGVQVLIAMRPNGFGKWSGRLYNRGDGKTYTGYLNELDARTIRVEGCVLSILCGGENLTRIK
jgi:uncharacterized protein (DUF2147 family)